MVVEGESRSTTRNGEEVLLMVLQDCQLPCFGSPAETLMDQQCCCQAALEHLLADLLGVVLARWAWAAFHPSRLMLASCLYPSPILSVQL
jgi:hypothetical protein